MGDKYRTLGAKIQAVREAQGISVEDAAARAELSVDQWQLLEAALSRDVVCSFSMLWSIAFALDVNVIDLIQTV